MLWLILPYATNLGSTLLLTHKVHKVFLVTYTNNTVYQSSSLVLGFSSQLTVSVIGIVLCKLVNQHLHRLDIPRHVMVSYHGSVQPNLAVHAARCLIDGNHLALVLNATTWLL